MQKIRLGSTTISKNSAPYIIAEIGVNHEGSLKKAKELIRLAKEGRAHAAKFQSYKAETLASRNSPAYWDLRAEPTKSQYQLFKKFDAFGKEEYQALAAYCSKIEIDFISTPFDDAAIEFLNPLMPFFKIASADITNLPFLHKVGVFGKPVVLSTGASTLAEIDQAVYTLQDAGCEEVVLLHCILNYPTKNKDAHLGMIHGLQKAFPNHMIGYSDHTLPDEGMMPLVTAYLLGARVIEKHFTFDKTLPGNDHYHAMDVRDLQRFRTRLGQIQELVGPEEHKHPLISEAIARSNARRSIVLKQRIAAGTALTEVMLTYKRPGMGISPIHWDEVIGRRVLRDLQEDQVLHWEDLESSRGDA